MMACNPKQPKPDTLNIQAYLRVRPLLPKEKKSSNLEFARREVVLKSSPDGKATKTFCFDRIFEEDSKQVAVYSAVVKPMIKDVIKGYNCTVFAYGQTGTGKTFTMSGLQSDPNQSWEENTQAGIIPRAVEDIFRELSALSCEFQVSVSFVELYNEKLKSLLSDFDDDTNIQVIDDADGGVFLKGLSPTPVKNINEAYQLLQKGAEKKQVAATLMNMQSSRSHTIFTISVNIKENQLDKDDVLRVGKLHLVDLAGSENVSKSGANDATQKSATGVNKRLAEASNINKSLLTLGRVITAITENSSHIPYRESKLTRLLRDSLGGKTKTSIIGTISPSSVNLDETENTLNYTYKARSIKNKPEKNMTISKKGFMQLATEEIMKLRRDLEAQRQGEGFFITKETHEEMVTHMKKLDEQVKEWHDRHSVLKASFDEHQELFNSLKDDFDEKCAVYDEMEKVFNNESEKLNKELVQARRIVTMHEFFIDEYKKNERDLIEQAGYCKKVSKKLWGLHFVLHNKVKCKGYIERKNLKALADYKKKVDEKLENLQQNVHKLYCQEDKGLARISNIAGDIYDQIQDQHVALKNSMDEYLEKSSEHTSEMITRLNNMSEEMGHSMDSCTNKMKTNLLNEINTLKLEACSFNEVAVKMAHQVDCINAGVHSVNDNIVKIFRESNWPDEVRIHRTNLRDGIHFIKDSIKQLNEKLDAAALGAEFTSKSFKELITKAEKLQEDLTDMQSTLQLSYVKANHSEQLLESALEDCVDMKDTTNDMFERFEEEDVSLFFKILQAWDVLKADLPRSALMKEQLMELKELILSNKNILSGRFNKTCDVLEVQDNLYSVQGNSVITDFKRATNTISDMAIELKNNSESFCTERVSQVIEYDMGIEDTFRRTQALINDLILMQHSNKETTSQQFEDIKKTVQDVDYSIDTTGGTTPPRLKLADLQLPESFHPTSPLAVLKERFEQNEKENHLSGANEPKEDPILQLSGSCSQEDLTQESTNEEKENVSPKKTGKKTKKSSKLASKKQEKILNILTDGGNGNT